jgi:hypothetical protein
MPGRKHRRDRPTAAAVSTRDAVAATLHCLTGCAIGEVLGMVLATWWSWSTVPSIVLATVLAFGFGYWLTTASVLRSGMSVRRALAVAVAADTVSIATMELIDNAVVLAVPGAMDAGLGTLLFWGSLAFALAVAFVAAVPVNRWLVAHGRGHAAVHRTGIHGGPSPRLVGAVLAVAFVFGTAVLIGEAA